MPVFFIDTSDEDHFVRDVVGHDLPDMEAAKTLAVDALPDMAREGLPDGDRRTFMAIVRDHHGRRLLTAQLEFSVIFPTVDDGAPRSPARDRQGGSPP